MNKELMIKAGFKEQVEKVDNCVCPFCSNKINFEDFKDALSKKEYGISGLCQACQDEIFN